MLLDISRRYCLFSDKSHYENVPFEIPKGWVWTTLGEISNYGESTNVPVDKISRESWVLELEDIEKDSGRLIQRRVKADRKINGVRHSFSNGCILYSKLRTYLNKVLIADQSGYCTTEIIPITCNKGVMPEYLCQVLRSNYFVDYTISLGYGVKMPRLGTADAIKSMIPLPPIHEQARIVALINRLATYIELLEANKQDAIEVANKIKSKILDFAVQGKLISQDPSDEPAIELLKRLIPQYKTADNRHYRNVPEGWAVCTFEDILEYEQPQQYIVNSTDYSDEYEIPVLTAGKSFIIGKTNEKSGVCKRLPVIIFDDFTTDSKYVDFPFKVKSSAIKILHAKGNVNPQYIAYLMSVTRLIGDTHKRYWISEYSKIPIMLPPVNEQEKIVSEIEKIYERLNKILAEL